MPEKSSPPSSPSLDERIIAALANVTIVLAFWGAIVIWTDQKDKSKYVALRSLLAVVCHLVLVLAGFLAGAWHL